MKDSCSDAVYGTSGGIQRYEQEYFLQSFLAFFAEYWHNNPLDYFSLPSRFLILAISGMWLLHFKYAFLIKKNRYYERLFFQQKQKKMNDKNLFERNPSIIIYIYFMLNTNIISFKRNNHFYLTSKWNDFQFKEINNGLVTETIKIGKTFSKNLFEI